MRASWVVGLAAALCSTTALAQAPLPPPKTFSSAVLDSPPAQALSVDADVLPIIQPGATPLMRKITPANLLGSSGFAYANACNPVVTYGADPTGIHSANEAINRCNGTQRNGQYVNTFLPGGTYRLTDAITVSSGQCLVFEPGLTVLSVDYDFSNSAAGVVIFSGGGQYGGASVPCIKGDPIIVFNQPGNIGSRSNFAALGSCGSNGKGCQYPPALLLNDAQRFDIEGVTIANAWDCIAGNGANAGDGNDHWGIIRCGAFNKGLNLSGIKDVIHMDAYYFWPYGISPDNNANIYKDGLTYAAALAEVDGFDADLFFTENARISINNPDGWFHFGKLMLDGDNATLNVAAAQWATISGGYATGGPTVNNTDCGAVTNAITVLAIANFRFLNSVKPSICNSGTMTVSNSTISQFTRTVAAITQSAGNMVLTGDVITGENAGAWTVPLVNATGGTLVMTGNDYNVVAVSGTAVSVVDSASNIIIGNNFSGWGFSAPGGAGTYWPNKLNSSGDTGSAYIRKGNVTADIDANGSAAAAHFLARGYSNANLQTWLGIDTTGQNGVLQSYKQGTGVLPLFIQPLGGAVGFGGDIIATFPTSCAGKATGTLWNNAGAANICP